MKFREKIVDCRLNVSASLGFGEVLDQIELERASRSGIRGIMAVQKHSSKKVLYSGSVGVSLRSFAGNPISSREFYTVLANIVATVKNMHINKFPIYNLYLDIDHSYVNEATNEVSFMYLPLSSGASEHSLVDYMQMFVENARPRSREDAAAIGRFKDFFWSLNRFSLEKIEAEILLEDRQAAVSAGRSSSGGSGFMTDKRQDYYAHYDAGADNRHRRGGPARQEEQHRTPADMYGNKSAAGTPAFSGDDFDENTGLLSQADEARYAADRTETEGDFENTGLLHENIQGASMIDGFYENTNNLPHYEESDMHRPPSRNGADPDYDYESSETTLLVPPGGEYGGAEYQSFPVMLRKINGEEFSINKPVYRIGKERAYVDGFVTDNSAVSRSHAEIISRGSKYFIKDLNSKNHTYINGKIIPVQFEVEIHNEDKITLANEEFVFKL